MIQNLAIASDHAGYNLKTFLINQLDFDINIKDFGTDNENSCDFPDFAQELCNFINENNSSYRGLLICGSVLVCQLQQIKSRESELPMW